jgi:hypothetical protein
MSHRVESVNLYIPRPPYLQDFKQPIWDDSFGKEHFLGNGSGSGIGSGGGIAKQRAEINIHIQN